MTFTSSHVRYIPALGVGALTPFFDSFQKLGAREGTFKPKLVWKADIQPNSKILDLGCGTGTLTILIKKSQPLANVRGIDIDPRVIEIAKTKACQANIQLEFDIGTAFNLPYHDNSFDRVISSLVFHHLTTENKIGALKEVRRILMPNGEVHIADIGRPQNLLMQLPSMLMRRLEETEDNIKGLIPRMLNLAGFNQIKETAQIMSLFGTISFYQAIKN